MKLNIIGQIFGTSGYCNHTRGLANALNKIHDVKLTTQLPDKWELDCNDSELQMINRTDDLERINIIIDLPHNWNQYLSKKHNIGFLVFEGDKIPLSWIDCIKDKRVTQVWVPSTHVFDAIKNTLTEDYSRQINKNKVKIVPHGVDLDVFFPSEQTEKEGVQTPRTFTFLCNKGFRNELDRGGIQHAIKAFLNEFKKGEAKLMIKLNLAYAMSPEALNEIIIKYYKETKKPKSEMPEIMAIYENLSPKQLSIMYNQCDVLLNPTEGEAFSLPCIEAMVCGKPVITTNFGGQIDYIDNINGWLIDYELHEVQHELIYEGIQWAKPNIEMLQNAMRDAVNNNKSVINKGAQALSTAKNYTWENSSLKATQYLEETNG